MKIARIAMFAVVAAIALPAAAQNAPVAASWSTFNSPEGVYTVQFPGQPKREEQALTTGPGSPGRTILYSIVSGRSIFLAGFAEYAPSFQFGTQAELLANRDNFVKGVQGNLLSTIDITMDGAPGIEFTAERPGAWFVRARVYIRGKRPVQAIALVPDDQRNSPDVNRFLSSFKFVPAR